jgi:hypothetical protein
MDGKLRFLAPWQTDLQTYAAIAEKYFNEAGQVS